MACCLRTLLCDNDLRSRQTARDLRNAATYPLILSNTAIPFVLSGFNSTDLS
jgi:hypothetical protein